MGRRGKAVGEGSRRGDPGPQLPGAGDPRRWRLRGRFALPVRVAAQTEADEIIFCGVHFMAETAKILSPSKRVLLPDLGAGCSLADTITADQLRAWKAEYPGAAVVAYVNTSAAVKAEADVCCTSSNAADVVRSIPDDQEILFSPGPVPRRARATPNRAREHAHLDGRVPRACRHLTNRRCAKW